MECPPLPLILLAALWMSFLKSSLTATSLFSPSRTRTDDIACCILRSPEALSSTIHRMRGLAQTVEIVPRAWGHPSTQGRTKMPSHPREAPLPILVSLLLFELHSLLQRPWLLHFTEYLLCAKHCTKSFKYKIPSYRHNLMNQKSLISAF